MITTPKTVYTHREAWMIAFIAAARPKFIAIGKPLPENIRCGLGFTSKGSKSKRIGECWTQECSDDQTFEIFIVPTIAVPELVASVITHELVHAAVGLAAGHGPKFKEAAHAVGLTGPMRATTAGPDWFVWTASILEDLGAYPHATLNHIKAESTGPKKQTCRILKGVCKCDRIIRASREVAASSPIVCSNCRTIFAFELDTDTETTEEPIEA